MDSNDNELIDENLDSNLQTDPQPKPKKNGNFLSNTIDAIQDYRDAGGIKGMAKSAIDNKKNEIKDNVKGKIDNKKQDLKNKVDAKLPESVKQKRDAIKAKNNAVKNKINNAKQKANDIKNAPDQIKQKLNEKAFRSGVKAAANLATPGLGQAADIILNTPKGEKALDAARQASNPITAVKEGTKKLLTIIAIDNLKKQYLPPILGFLCVFIIIFVVIGGTFKASSSFDYFQGNGSGISGLDAVGEEYKEFYEAVEQYGSANKHMVVAVLTAYTDNDDYTGDIDDVVDLCTEEEIESGDCSVEVESGITTYSKSKIKKYIKKVNKAIQESGGDITEGDYNDPRNTGSKFFKWLYTDFIDDYYKKYVTDDQSKIKIIREIYLFYKELIRGKGDCSNSFVNLTCPQVTVTGEAAGSYALEDYIAAVVANELGYSGYPEAIRAQAIAARTYLFSVTNNCKNSIENSTNAQTMNPDKVNDEIRKAVQDTAGMVLTKDGKVFMSQYSTFSPNMNCMGSVCTGTFYKQPSKTQSTITIDLSKLGFNKGNLAGGHTNGMSQYGALYLDKVEKKNYEEILKTFYDEDSEISSTTTSNVEGIGGTCGLTDSGLVQVEGYSARLLRPQRNNAFYYDQSSNLGASGRLEGECSWYASARAQEILSTLGSDVTWTYYGNGGNYCDFENYDKNKFETSTDVYSPRQGAIISWKDGSYGHVAVVEKVEGNTVTLSQAGLTFGPTGLYGCSNGSCVRRYIRNLTDRRTYCEADGSGCFNVTTLDISEVKNYSGLNFQCYIYLGSKK